MPHHAIRTQPSSQPHPFHQPRARTLYYLTISGTTLLQLTHAILTQPYSLVFTASVTVPPPYHTHNASKSTPMVTLLHHLFTYQFIKHISLPPSPRSPFTRCYHQPISQSQHPHPSSHSHHYHNHHHRSNQCRTTSSRLVSRQTTISSPPLQPPLLSRLYISRRYAFIMQYHKIPIPRSPLRTLHVFSCTTICFIECWTFWSRTFWQRTVFLRTGGH